MNGGSTWPEQNEIDQWWREHSYDLKERVTKFRIQCEKEIAVMRKALERIEAEHTDESDPEPALKFCSNTAKEALKKAQDIREPWKSGNWICSCRDTVNPECKVHGKEGG